eukprot:16187397-Heterocapsa_arctica.AAC.1
MSDAEPTWAAQPGVAPASDQSYYPPPVEQVDQGQEDEESFFPEDALLAEGDDLCEAEIAFAAVNFVQVR